MILELNVKVIVAVPDDALGGGATPEALTGLAEQKAEEKLKALFLGWATHIDADAVLDGRPFPKG